MAAWASALGARSRLICKRGTDVASELAAAELARHGVEICGPVVEGRGGVVVSVRDAHGRRTMASDRGVASLLDPSELDPSWVRSCDVLHVSGYCLLREPMAAAAIEAARPRTRVTVDLASAHDIEIVGAEQFAARLGRSARSRVRHRVRAGRRARLRCGVGDQARRAGREVPRGPAIRPRRSSRSTRPAPATRSRPATWSEGPSARSRPRRGASA